MKCNREIQEEHTCSCLKVVPSATALPPPSADDIALVGDAVSGVTRVKCNREIQVKHLHVHV